MPDHVIEDGCYLIRYEPIEQPDDVLFFEGTARVMRVGPDGKRNEKGELAAGADLYWRPGCQCDPDLRKERPKLWEDNDPTSWNKVDNDGNAIPIFPRKLYRYYLQITQIMEDVPKKNISLSISVYEFKQDTIWPNPGSRWVCLNKVTPQIGNE